MLLAPSLSSGPRGELGIAGQTYAMLPLHGHPLLQLKFRLVSA
jgi:hypothetical protein